MLRWMTAGESHGPALVAVVDGLPTVTVVVLTISSTVAIAGLHE